MKQPEYGRDALFLALAGVFLTALVMGNIIGTTKFVTIFETDLPDWMLGFVPQLVRDGKHYVMSVPAGVLAYPFTFLATDLISELYGRKRAQLVVWVGFWMNLFMLLIMSFAAWLPDTYGVSGGTPLFEGVFRFMIGNTLASMFAYLIAQSVDVKLFHFWKNLTKGKHLWLRNNGSTMISQLVDSTTILTILYLAGNLGDAVTGVGALTILIINSYLFKFIVAALDTPLFYAGAKWLGKYNEDPEYAQYHES